jgi:hypothetical protein
MKRSIHPPKPGRKEIFPVEGKIVCILKHDVELVKHVVVEGGGWGAARQAVYNVDG